MSGNGNQVPLAPNQRGPGPYPRASTPHRPVECYHPTGAAGAAYMPSTAGGAQTSTQATFRGQPTPQPSAPPAPQQDMSKTSMAGHNYVSQNQTQPRAQYPGYQFRAAQHGSRPNTHPRQQQQPFMPSAAATATGPVIYPTLVFPPTHMGMQSYQQPRSSTPGFFQYPHYISYNTPPNHTPQYFYTPNSPQLPTPNLPANAPGGRTNPTTLVGPQGTSATPTAPTVSLTHPQAPTHMHQPMPGGRPTVTKRFSHRIAIIDPETNQDVLSEYYSNNDSFVSGETNDRQTPQPESSIAEEFTRRVNEVANQPCDSVKTNYLSKNVDLPVSSSNVQTQQNAISSLNNNIVKSDILTVNENKNLGPDVAVEPNETPIVSAISDSPVIVPKMPMNNKQIQKNSELNVQPVVLDTNKNIPNNKQQKQNKNKPVVPQVEDLEKKDNISSVVPQSNINVVATASTASATVTVTTAAAVTVTATDTLSVTSVTHSVPTPVQPVPAAPVQTSSLTASTPQPQRIREPRERLKSQEKEAPITFSKTNGPTNSVAISSVDSLPEVINPPTSQNNQATSADSSKKAAKQIVPTLELEIASSCETKPKAQNTSGPSVTDTLAPTATELLSASIEKLAKEQPLEPNTIAETKEGSSAIEAQAKLTQSISSVLRVNQPESTMKDINLNNKTTDADTANGNSTDATKTETVKEEINKNEKGVKNTKNSSKKSAKMANTDVNIKEAESCENGKNETDKVDNVVQENTAPAQEENVANPPPIVKPDMPPPPPPVFVPKYKYNKDQWSPLNTTGKKCYDIGLLKQIKENPLSKNKPNVPLLESCNIIRTTPMQEPINFASISRPMNDSFLPPFAKSVGMGSRNNMPRDAKKDGRNMPTGKGSVKLPPSSGGSNSQKSVIHVSLSLREDVKLNEVDSAWKPTRFRKENLAEEENKTQELYKKFRGILNKLTPQKFDTLMDRIKSLEINNQKRLEGVIDLVFEKAIDEPNFSEAYALMCQKLSALKVPADNATSPEHYVNFRALIITKCQNQFMTDKIDDQVLKLEKELAECTDPAKKKELQLMIDEENRRVRMRSVGNVRFIGELYKLKMLTSKIMDYCMKHLIDKLEEEKLECLCKLLTTIGEQVENEANGQLDSIFKKMQEIVDRKSNKISSRVRFMIQDVIALRKRKWATKSVVDSQPKMMDHFHKEAEQQQRHIELMNANTMGGFRRDEGGRGKRGGEGRRQNANNSFMDNWKPSKASFPVDTSKLKAVTQKNLNNIKLAPHNQSWNQGSGAKNIAQAVSSNSIISLTKNKYSVLENVQTDPTTLRGTRDMTPSYHARSSMERTRGDFVSGNASRSGSMGVSRSNSGTRNTSAVTPSPASNPETPVAPPTTIPQEPLSEALQKSVKAMIDLSLINPDDNEIVAEVKQRFAPQYHASVITSILNVVLEKTAKEVAMITKSLLHLVSTNTISAENFITGIKEIFEVAPDLYIDIPMLYDYLGKIIALQIEKKHITFVQALKLSESVISAKQGHLFLKTVITQLEESMGPTFVKSKWQESGLQFKEWMDEDQVQKWITDNKLEFLEGGASKTSEEIKTILSPAETQAKLIELMNCDENCECIKGWVQDNLGEAANEDWFMRTLIQAICTYALFSVEGRDEPRFNQDRMNKYAGLISEFGETKQAREAACLFGIQQLILRLEHPQGLSLEIFQYLHEQYIISLDGFIAWEQSDKEPEGKGVMMMALTSFFTNIKEADNEDSCSED